MGLITEPDDYESSTATLFSILNTLKSLLFDLVNGNIDNANIKSGAAIDVSKIDGSAASLTGSGTQEVTRASTVSGSSSNPFYEKAQGGWSFDPAAGNTQAISINSATTFALTAGKGVYQVSIVGAETLTTITGGAEGDVIYLHWMAADNTLTVTHTAATTADTISLRGRANETWTVAGGVFVVRLRYTAALGGTGKWYEC